MKNLILALALLPLGVAVANAGNWTLTVYNDGNPSFFGPFPTKTACEAKLDNMREVVAGDLQDEESRIHSETGAPFYRDYNFIQTNQSALQALESSAICERR